MVDSQSKVNMKDKTEIKLIYMKNCKSIKKI